jgi:3-oxoacyl-[acyl-carrier protein] reductase
MALVVEERIIPPGTQMRTVFITGGTRGIGAAIARRFEREGFSVVAPTRGDLDLADPKGVETWIAKRGIEADVLVNNAGENVPASIEDVTLAHFERTLAVNLTSAFLLLRAAAPRMVARGFGRVVNVSSCWSLLGRRGRAPYAASKAALDALTRTAALEYGVGGVLVNSVCPGFVDTELTRRNNSPEEMARVAEQTALGRLARPEEVAELAFWLGSEKNTYVTGQMVVVDGGFVIQ